MQTFQRKAVQKGRWRKRRAEEVVQQFQQVNCLDTTNTHHCTSNTILIAAYGPVFCEATAAQKGVSNRKCPSFEIFGAH